MAGIRATRAMGMVLRAGEAGGSYEAKAWAREVLADLKLSLSNPARSAPYEPPGVITGHLRDSYDADVSIRHGVIVVEVGSGVEYAGYLEFGTSKMEPRPHLRPAMDRGRIRLGSQLAAQIEKFERGAARLAGGKG